MLILDGSPDLGLIVHEVGHNYVQGILANNEWREAWLDEGFSNFQRGWMFEILGRPSTVPRSEATILEQDLDNYSEPVGLPAPAFREYSMYYRMSYTRGELFFHQLRYIVGDDVMLQILRTYYERWKLKHVDEEAFKAVAEEVSQRDLSDFFAQWLHTTELYDYKVGRVEAARSGGGWITRVEVVRESPGRIPVEVAVIGERDTSITRSEGVAEREWVEVATESRPRAVLLDPRVQTHDWNMVNNRKELGFRWTRLLTPFPDPDIYFHPYFSTRSRRERGTFGWHPTVWYNDAGGVTLGLWSRDDYLGRFDQNVAWLTRSTGWGADDGVEHFDVYSPGSQSQLPAGAQRLADGGDLQGRGTLRRNRQDRAEPPHPSASGPPGRKRPAFSGFTPTTSAISTGVTTRTSARSSFSWAAGWCLERGLATRRPAPR